MRGKQTTQEIRCRKKKKMFFDFYQKTRSTKKKKMLSRQNWRKPNKKKLKRGGGNFFVERFWRKKNIKNNFFCLEFIKTRGCDGNRKLSIIYQSIDRFIDLFI